MATDSSGDTTNRNQPLLFFHMDPTNTIVWAWERFIGLVVSCALIFSKTWVENQRWTPEASTISVATDSPGDITNRNQPLLLFQMDPTNTIVRTWKRFIGLVVSFVMQG
jgi:hypothetical protein